MIIQIFEADNATPIKKMNSKQTSIMLLKNKIEKFIYDVYLHTTNCKNLIVYNGSDWLFQYNIIKEGECYTLKASVINKSINPTLIMDI